MNNNFYIHLEIEEYIFEYLTQSTDLYFNGFFFDLSNHTSLIFSLLIFQYPTIFVKPLFFYPIFAEMKTEYCA